MIIIKKEFIRTNLVVTLKYDCRRHRFRKGSFTAVVYNFLDTITTSVICSQMSQKLHLFVERTECSPYRNICY